MTIFEKIELDIKQAMKVRNNFVRDTLRFMKSKIQQAAIDSRKPIDNDMCITAAKKLVKQCQDSLEHLEGDKAQAVVSEIGLYDLYIPAVKNESDTKDAVQEAIDRTGAESARDMGKVMGFLKKAHGATIDMSVASKMVKEQLS